MDPYIGEMRLLPYNFAPVGWHDCDGSLLPIAENEALFTLLGTTFGGDGQTTFGLPDMRGRVPVHNGTGPGAGTYVLGQMAGTESVTLTAQQMPMHTHGMAVTTAAGTSGAPSSGCELGAVNGEQLYTSDISGLPAAPFADTMIGAAGGSQPHDNCMPTLTMRFCIALAGVYPTQS